MKREREPEFCTNHGMGGRVGLKESGLGSKASFVGRAALDLLQNFATVHRAPVRLTSYAVDHAMESRATLAKVVCVLLLRSVARLGESV